MNYIFHDLIGQLVEVYIDDVVVKSALPETHLADLRRVLERRQLHGLKVNPKKCAFGVAARQFLYFMVHERGIEIGDKSKNAITTMTPPGDKKQLQSLIGKLNYIRRLILNLFGRIEPFMPLVKIKSASDFTWGQEQQKAFDDLKQYLSDGNVPTGHTDLATSGTEC